MKTRIGAGRIYLYLIMGLLFLVNAANAQKWGKVTDEEWQLGAPADYPEANAVIIFDIGLIEVSSSRVELDRHVRIKILNKAGIDEVGDFGFRYRDDDKIKGLKAHTITPDGKKHKVDKKEFYTKTYGGYEIKTFAFPALDSGCVVEFKYANINDRFGQLNPWYFQSNIYTLTSRLSITLWPGFVYSQAVVQVPMDRREPKSEFLPNPADPSGRRKRKLAWELNNMPPIKDEPYMSFRENYMAALYNQLVSYETSYYKQDYITGWADVGDRFQKYIDDYVNSKKEIGLLADSLTAGIETPRGKAEAIYYYVINGYKNADNDKGYYFNNNKLSDLLELKSGTSDEKNVLLTELLKAAGLDSWVVLIGTRDKTVFMPQVYQSQQFNHMISLVDFKTSAFYMDAASKYCPFGVLPADSRASGGVLLEGKESELVKVMTEQIESSRRDYTRMHINGDGSANCSTSVTFTGYFATCYGRDCDRKKPDEFVKDNFLDKLDLSYETEEPCFSHDSLSVLEMDVAYSLSDCIRRLDDNVIVKPVKYYFRENPFESERRFFPVDFNYPFVYQNVVEVEFEDSVVSTTMPDSIRLEIPGAEFTRKCTCEGGKILIDCTLDIKRPIFPGGLYTRLRDFFIEMAATTEDEVVARIASN